MAIKGSVDLPVPLPQYLFQRNLPLPLLSSVALGVLYRNPLSIPRTETGPPVLPILLGDLVNQTCFLLPSSNFPFRGLRFSTLCVGFPLLCPLKGGR